MNITVDPSLPCVLAGVDVASFAVRPLGFFAYAAAAERAARGAKDDKSVTRAMFRERVKLQVSVVPRSGAPVALTDETVSAIPARYAVAIKDAISAVLVDSTANLPALTVEGDGTTCPVEVRLGSPLVLGKDKNCDFLEFQAATLADLEDVLAEDTKLGRAVAFIRLAKPVNAGSLISLPSTALDNLSLSDGIFIMDKVVDPFFALLGGSSS
jgi:hypothetical protein